MSTPPTSSSPITPRSALLPTNQSLILLRGIGGALVGGVAGYFIFHWLSSQGYYGSMIPGALLGLSAGLCARGKSVPLGIVCLVLAIGLAVFTEWHVLYSKNHSFAFFLANFH